MEGGVAVPIDVAVLVLFTLSDLSPLVSFCFSLSCLFFCWFLASCFCSCLCEYKMHFKYLDRFMLCFNGNYWLLRFSKHYIMKIFHYHLCHLGSIISISIVHSIKKLKQYSNLSDQIYRKCKTDLFIHINRHYTFLIPRTLLRTV